MVRKRTPSSSPNATISIAWSSRSPRPASPSTTRERGERAVIAVVAAGVAHRVDMRAQHQRRRARAPALVAGDDVAGGVDPRLEPGFRAPADEGLRGRRVRVGEKEPREPPRLVGEGRERFEPRHQLARRRRDRRRRRRPHQFWAVRRSSQRASTARSSSVIWEKLLGGIAWVSTACMRIAGGEARDMLGRVEQHALGRLADSSIGSAAWHIDAARHHDLDHLRRRLRLDWRAPGGGRQASASPMRPRMPGEAVAATHESAERWRAAAAAQAHQGALVVIEVPDIVEIAHERAGDDDAGDDRRNGPRIGVGRSGSGSTASGTGRAA